MNRQTAKVMGVITSAALAFSCAHGGNTAALQPSSAVAKAHGKVSTATTDDGSTEVAVVVDSLKPPQRVVPGTSAYVVWAQPLTPGAAPQNLGVLGAFGHQSARVERSELLTRTPLKTFDVMITPEASANVSHPSNTPVMKAKVAR